MLAPLALLVASDCRDADVATIRARPVRVGPAPVVGAYLPAARLRKQDCSGTG